MDSKAHAHLSDDESRVVDPSCNCDHPFNNDHEEEDILHTRDLITGEGEFTFEQGKLMADHPWLNEWWFDAFFRVTQRAIG